MKGQGRNASERCAKGVGACSAHGRGRGRVTAAASLDKTRHVNDGSAVALGSEVGVAPGGSSMRAATRTAAPQSQQRPRLIDRSRLVHGAPCEICPPSKFLTVIHAKLNASLGSNVNFLWVG